jgi:hypothetical protein
MSRWRITKNKNHSTGNDRLIEMLEGEYDSLTDAMDAMQGFELVTLPDGSMWAYDADYEGIADDVAGLHALAIVSMVVE